MNTQLPDDFVLVEHSSDTLNQTWVNIDASDVDVCARDTGPCIGANSFVLVWLTHRRPLTTFLGLFRGLHIDTSSTQLNYENTSNSIGLQEIKKDSSRAECGRDSALE